MIECQYELPFCQISQFAAIQAIMDNVASAKTAHLVDPGIKTGSYWPVMMQALADRYDCPLELLKITAVGPSKQIIEEVGNQLSSVFFCQDRQRTLCIQGSCLREHVS